MITKQCDRCKLSIELNEEPTQKGFLCRECVVLWKVEERKWLYKITFPELREKFIAFIESGEPVQNTTLK